MKRNIKLILLLPVILSMTVLLAGCAHVEISFSISANPRYFTQAGQEITLTYYVTNTGDSDWINRVRFLDGSEGLNCPEYMGFEYDYTCTLVYTVTEADVARLSFIHSNRALAAYNGGIMDSAILSDVVPAEVEVHFVEPQALSVSIYTAPPSFSRVGEEITYSFSIRNIGDVPVNEPITIEDSLMTANCPSIQSLRVNSRITCEGIYTITRDDFVAGVVQNTAQASSGPFNSDPVTYQILLNPEPALGLEVSGEPNFYANKGDRISFVYTVTNIGNVPLSGPFEIIAENLVSWTCPAMTSLGVQESLTCNGIFQITQGEYGYHYTHHAQVQGIYEGQVVLSEVASATIYFSPPVTKLPEPEPGINCSNLDIAECLDLPASCVWDSVTSVCKNK